MIIKGSLTGLLLVFTVIGVASSQVITNEQLVINAVRSGVESNFKSGEFGIVTLKVNESELSRLITIGLAEGFDAINIDVVGNDSALPGVKVIECDELGFDFEYENGKSRGFLRSKMIKRKFTSLLKLTISDRDSQSLSDIRNLTLKLEDQIDPGLTELVKSRSIAALAPSLPSSGIKKVIEPVIVTAAAGGLVYLFFANR